MPYERDSKKSVSPTVVERASNLPDDLCCDGCAEKYASIVNLDKRKGLDMAYDCDYVKRAGHIEFADELTPDLCCDGCAEHCQISLRMVVDGKYSIKNGNQTMFIKPAMYVGEKKLGNEFLYERIQKDPDGIRVDFDYADKAYLYALGMCRKTCKNSRLR